MSSARRRAWGLLILVAALVGVALLLLNSRGDLPERTERSAQEEREGGPRSTPRTAEQAGLEQSRGTLAGDVVSEHSGLPVSGARVEVDNLPATRSTETGSFGLSIPTDSAEITLRVTRDGFLPTSLTVRRLETTWPHVHVLLQPGRGLRLRVVTADGTPVPGAHVQGWQRDFRQTSPRRVFEAVTSADGTIARPWPQNGPGSPAVDLVLDARAPDHSWGAIRLLRPPSEEGVIVVASPAVEVELRPGDWTQKPPSWADLEVIWKPPETHDIALYASGWRPLETVRIHQGATEAITLRVPPGFVSARLGQFDVTGWRVSFPRRPAEAGRACVIEVSPRPFQLPDAHRARVTVAFEVVDEAGKPIRGARADLLYRIEREPGFLEGEETDAHGRATVSENTRQGAELRAVAWHPGFALAEKTLAIVESDEVRESVQLVLTPGARDDITHLRVVSAGSAPLRKVDAWWVDDKPFFAGPMRCLWPSSAHGATHVFFVPPSGDLGDFGFESVALWAPGHRLTLFPRGELSPRDDPTQVVELSLPPGPIVDVHVVAESGEPIPDVRVMTAGAVDGVRLSRIMPERISNAGGNARVHVSTPEQCDVWIIALHPSFGASARKWEEGESSVELRLRGLASLSGTVLTPDATPIPEASIVVLPLRIGVSHQNYFAKGAYTVADGTFRLEGFPIGLPLTIQAHGSLSREGPYLELETEVVAVPDGEVRLVLRPRR